MIYSVVFVSALFYIQRLMVLGPFSSDFMVENIYCEKEQPIPVILASLCEGFEGVVIRIILTIVLIKIQWSSIL